MMIALLIGVAWCTARAAETEGVHCSVVIDQHGDEAAIRAAERAEAHCAIIVGDREEPSGESRLKYKRGD